MKDNLRDTFLDLIQIPEVYPYEHDIIDYIESYLNEAGIKTVRDSYNNIIAYIGGEGEPFMVATHMDVPEANPNVRYIEDGDIIKADGTNILGADPKSGLAVLLEFLKYLQTTDPSTHRPVEAVIVRGEEAGLQGSANLDYSLLNSKSGVVLDEDGPVTRVITKAPTKIIFDATFIGKSQHPSQPEDSINMTAIISKTTGYISNGYIQGVGTFNIGCIRAGTARNVTPGKAELQGEFRGFDTRTLTRAAKDMETRYKEIARTYGAKCEIRREIRYHGYRLSKESHLIKRLRKKYRDMSLKPVFAKTYGGSDANMFNKKGIKSVAIGSGYYNPHEYTEYINLAEMVQILEFLNRFVRD